MLLLVGATPARSADPQQDAVDQQVQQEVQRILGELDLQDLQTALDELQNPPDDLRNADQLVTQLAQGQFTYLGQTFLNYMLDSAREPLTQAVALFAELLLLAAVSGVLAQMTRALTGGGAAKIASLLVYGVAAVLILHGLWQAVDGARTSITTLLNVTQAVFPVLTALLAASGGFASTAVLQPAFAVAAQTASWLVRDLLLPAALCGGVLSVAGSVTQKNLLKEFGSLLRSAGVWVAGAVMTVFVALTAIQGSAAVSYDGISFRTAKYAVDSMVPYVGGMFSDLADTLVGCSLLVRNAVGVAGLLALLAAIIPPVLSALGIYLAYRLAGALAASFDADGLCTVMGESGKVVMLLVVILLMTFVLMFLMLTVTIGAGNSILAMR